MYTSGITHKSKERCYRRGSKGRTPHGYAEKSVEALNPE